jgi:hypothetical protein
MKGVVDALREKYRGLSTSLRSGRDDEILGGSMHDALVGLAFVLMVMGPASVAMHSALCGFSDEPQ